MKKTLLVQLAALCCLVNWAYAQETTIGVYVDAAGTQCTGTTSGGVIVGSVWVNLAGAAAGGITGAEFRIENTHRSETTVGISPDPNATIVLGDPFNLAGMNIAYEFCQTGPRVRLLTFTLTENVAVTDVELLLTQHYRPSNPSFGVCPLVTLCDGPVYTKVCVGMADSVHWRAVIDQSVVPTAACVPVSYPLGLEPSTWGQVKQLYRG